MQTSLMFVDLKPLGVTPNSQKIAIKMPEGAENSGVDGDSGFSDIISALMEITPEQLRNSFEEMEWVKVQGESTGYAPLFDLSAAQASGADMAQKLIGELAHSDVEQSKPLGLRFVDIGRLDDGSVGFIKTNMDPFDSQASNNMEFSKGNILQSRLNSTSQGLSQTVMDSTTQGLSQTDLNSTTQGLSHSGSGSSTGENFSDIKTIQNNLDHSPHPVGRSQLPLSHVPAPPNENADLKPSLDEDIWIDKDTSVSTVTKAQSKNIVSNPKDLTVTTVLPEEMTNKSAKPNDHGMTKTTAIQNDAKTNLTAEQATNQEFGDFNNPDTATNLKQASKERQPSEDLRQNFNMARGEVSTEASNDETDPLTDGKQDNRVLFQQAVSRLKGAPVKSVEYASGHHESTSQTGDTQSNVIRQIVQRMSLHHQGSQSTMTLKLKPEFLGNVHMQISTDNQQVAVRMATESTAVKEMVEQGLQHLKAEMQHHGLEIDKFDVFVANDNEQFHPGQDLTGFRQTLKQRQQNAMKKGPSSSKERDKISEKQVEEHRGTVNTSDIDYFA